MKEYYYDSRTQGEQKTDEEYYMALCSLTEGYDIKGVIVDPSAASFIECIERHGKFRVLRAENQVVDGIRKVSHCLKEGTIKIHRSCKDSIREFSLYRWEENTGRDAPKKENDHAMDDIRYFVSTIVCAQQEEEFFVLSAKRE